MLGVSGRQIAAQVKRRPLTQSVSQGGLDIGCHWLTPVVGLYGPSPSKDARSALYLPSWECQRESTPLSPKTQIKTGSPIGPLEVPRLRISVIVFEGSDQYTLQLGTGHIEHTALTGEPGNRGIAGHRDTFFDRSKTFARTTGS